MKKIAFLDLMVSDIHIVISLIEKRMEVLKKRVLKQHGADWYDYDDNGLSFKIKERSKEYERLDIVLTELYKAQSR